MNDGVTTASTTVSTRPCGVYHAPRRLRSAARFTDCRLRAAFAAIWLVGADAPKVAPVTDPAGAAEHLDPATADRFLTFEREAWAALRAATPLTLGEDELEDMRGIHAHIDLDEVAAIYLPLSRLLNLYVSATQDLHRVSATFLGAIAPKVPYVIGIAGSVAVGKSTFARILQALLARWPDHPKVDLLTTDGFLHPNRVLEARGIMNRKGFPESYDTRELLRVLREIKSGDEEVGAPVYSHVVYDIIDGEQIVVKQPDIVIVEGLNVLQTSAGFTEFVSDYFDFSIYIDADEVDIEHWYVERFLALRESVFRDPDSFFRAYAALSDEEAVATARGIWREINGLNLRDNIAPTRGRASLVLHKNADHRVNSVRLRRL
ncbi:MAG: type I pantothenate kinase [Ilumatobacter sp.]|nr:type I pantothenate kinase [Ilumatobacter sp.]